MKNRIIIFISILLFLTIILLSSKSPRLQSVQAQGETKESTSLFLYLPVD